MRCPCCNSELIVTHRDRYESLDEHVSSCNVSMKDGYQCLDFYCIANNLVATWTDDGEIFVDPPLGIKVSTAIDSIIKSSSTGMSFALDSWSNSYHLMIKEKNASKIQINLYFWKLDFIRKFEYQDCNVYKKKFAWNVTIWKRTKGHYVIHMSFFRMFLFVLKNFNKKLATISNPYTNTPDKMQVYSISECLEKVDTKDKRLYAKAAALYLKIFRYRDISKLRSLLRAHELSS